MIHRGEVWWAELGPPRGSAPALRRPVVVVSADYLNRSQIRTVTAVVMTSSLQLAGIPGNVLVRAKSSGLERDSVVNVTQLQTLDKSDLDTLVRKLPLSVLRGVDNGLRRAFDL